jgi:hypothetical protein
MPAFLCAILLFVSTGCFSATGDVVRRGASIPTNAELVPLASVVASPRAFTSQTIVTEGVVDKVCLFAGCWMNVAPAPGEPGMRVTFAEGAFVAPRNSGGRHARLLGTVEVAEDKTAFVARGIELTASSR